MNSLKPRHRQVHGIAGIYHPHQTDGVSPGGAGGREAYMAQKYSAHVWMRPCSSMDSAEDALEYE